MALVVESFNGTDIQTATYAARVLQPDQIENRAISPVVVRPSGRNGRFLRSDVQPRIIPVHITILSGTMDTEQAALGQIFTLGTVGELVVTYNSVSRALTCRVERTIPYDGGNRLFTAVLVAEDPEWHSASAQTNTQQQTVSATTWNISNAGNVADYRPSFKLQPKTAKTASNGFLYKREVIIANRVARSFNNYAFDVTNGGLDHATLVSGGKSQADGDDVRVRVDGVETPRWFGEHTDNDANSALTKIWINLTLSPAKTASLLSAITNVSPANNGDLEVVKGGTSGWPSSGALVVDDEVITYTGITENNSNGRAAFTGITRGARNTTAAAHDAADVCYWIERRILLVYGHTGISAPDARNEQKPMLNMASNTLTNVQHEWLAFAHATDPRSMQWSRASKPYTAFADDNICQPTGSPATSMDVRDGRQVGYLPSNVWERAFPSTVSGVVTWTRTRVGPLATRFIGTDTDGYDTQLDLEVGDQSSASDSTASLSDIAALRLQTFVPLVASTDYDTVQNVGDYLTTGTGTTNDGVRIRTGDEPTKLYAVQAYLICGGTGRTMTARIYTDDGAATPAPSTLVATSANVSYSATEAKWGLFTFSTPVELGANANYWLCITQSAGADVSWMYDNYPHYDGDGSINWRRVGGVSASGARTPSFRVLGALSDYTEEPLLQRWDLKTVLAPGSTASYDAITVPLLSTGVPYFALKAEQDCYWLNGTFGNNTTSQTVVLDVICVDEDEIEIDVEDRTVRNATTGENLLACAKFSDNDEWFRLAVGTNQLVWTETGIARVDITSTWRNRWQ